MEKVRKVGNARRKKGKNLTYTHQQILQKQSDDGSVDRHKLDNQQPAKQRQKEKISQRYHFDMP